MDIDADFNPSHFEVKGDAEDCSFVGSIWNFKDDGLNGEIQGPDGTWYVLYTDEQRWDYSYDDYDYEWDEYDEFDWEEFDEYDYMDEFEDYDNMDEFEDYDWSADFSGDEFDELAALEDEMAYIEDFDFDSFDFGDFDMGDFDFGGF